MAWSTPRDWVAGELVTEAIMDTHIKDQFNAIITDGIPTLRVTGVSTLSGDVALTADSTIRRNTSDGSDNGFVVLAGGGGSPNTRGASINVYGNESTSAGRIVMNIGNVAASQLTVARSDGTDALVISGLDSEMTLTSSRSTFPAWDFKGTHASTPNGMRVFYTVASPNGTGNEFYAGVDSTTTRFAVRSNGGIANFQANDVNLSDECTKDIAGPAPAQRAYFRRLQPVLARYKDAHDTPLDVMITAQQVQQVYPDLVTQFSDGKLGVREHGLLMRAFVVIQELDAELLELQARVAALEE